MSTAVAGTQEREEAMALVAEAQRRGLPVPAELEHELYIRELIRRGKMPWRTFRSYVEYCNPSLLNFEHVPRLVQAGQDVLDGGINALMVLLPPRYFKTVVFSHLLASYAMRRYPHRLVGLSSYNGIQSRVNSESARDLFSLAGGKLSETSSAKSYWKVQGAGGVLWAVGVAEGTLGRGMHLGICDDPIDPMQMRSSAFQRRFQGWWDEKWLSRREPGARLILVMQRLGTDDPVDYLFRREVGENTECRPMHWHVLVMDELKSSEPLGRWDGPQGLPKTCTLIEDSRSPGEALAPSRNSPDAVKAIHASISSIIVSAQRQQRPMLASGDFWKRDWLQQTYDELPADAVAGGKDWDTAFTDNEANAASAYVESYKRLLNVAGKMVTEIYIQDCGWEWKDFPKLVAWMQDLDGPHYVEAKASGKSAVQALTQYGVPAKEVSVLGGKLERAAQAQPAVANHRIFIRKAIYDSLLFGEGQGLLRVTHEMLRDEQKGGLDLNDAFVQAIWRHLGLGKQDKKRTVSWA